MKIKITEIAIGETCVNMVLITIRYKYCCNVTATSIKITLSALSVWSDIEGRRFSRCLLK